MIFVIMTNSMRYSFRKMILSELNVDDRKKQLRTAVICSSNMNRSMEAHRLLHKKGFNIASFGTGTQVTLVQLYQGQIIVLWSSCNMTLGQLHCNMTILLFQVKLPGTAADKPNVYPFDTPYQQIYQDLCNKDKPAYTQNGVLNMLDRNRRIKKNPEKFQTNKEPFNIILTCEGWTHSWPIKSLLTYLRASIRPSLRRF